MVGQWIKGQKQMGATEKLSQQAGKFVQLRQIQTRSGAISQGPKLNPGNTTIVNTIGNLYLRLGNKAEALLWYQRLANEFRSLCLAN
jgi:hypothetical protein